MGICAAQTFSNISADRWAALKAKAAQNHIILNADSGEASQHGFTFRWQYDSASATLVIQCLNHPAWASCGAVIGKVHDLVGDDQKKLPTTI